MKFLSGFQGGLSSESATGLGIGEEDLFLAQECLEAPLRPFSGGGLLGFCHPLPEHGFSFLPDAPVRSKQAVGERLTIPYEALQGRRVNGIGAYWSARPEAGRYASELGSVSPSPASPGKASGWQRGREECHLCYYNILSNEQRNKQAELM